MRRSFLILLCRTERSNIINARVILFDTLTPQLLNLISWNWAHKLSRYCKKRKNLQEALGIYLGLTCYVFNPEVIFTDSNAALHIISWYTKLLLLYLLPGEESVRKSRSKCESEHVRYILEWRPEAFRHQLAYKVQFGIRVRGIAVTGTKY